MKYTKQMSDTLLVGLLLAMVGGFLEAYTYITRGGVFANAQTGNIVLLGITLSEGNIKRALTYLIPIITFVLGIIVAEVIKSRYKMKKKVHWRQIIVFIEGIVLFLVAFIPDTHHMIANAIIAFVCSLQVESFRKVEGNPYATTMCTGNLRSATELFYYYRKNKDPKALIKSMQYFCIIIFFIIGGCIGTILSKIFFLKAVLFSLILLIMVILLMNKKENQNDTLEL